MLIKSSLHVWSSACGQTSLYPHQVTARSLMKKLPAEAGSFLTESRSCLCPGNCTSESQVKKGDGLTFVLCAAGSGEGQQGRAMDKKKVGVTHRCEDATAAVC